jgi:gluconate:H+ symporter, GntP family
MTTWLILLAGIAVVVGGIIWLRIHAFASLILGALLVAVLTPSGSVVRSQVARHFVPVTEVSFQSEVVTVTAKHGIEPDSVLLLDRGLATTPVVVASLQSSGNDAKHNQAQVDSGQDVTLRFTLSSTGSQLLSSGGSEEEPSPVGLRASQLQIVARSQWQSAVELSNSPPMARLTTALGKACGKLAILIVAASIIGACLLESGGAERIVRACLAVFTERLAPLAFMVAGFVLAIPVFFDTVFLLMIPLGKSMYRRTGRNYLLYVLSILIGATMAHSLVPPTPGPLLIASELNVTVLQMAIGGCVVGGCGALGGLLFAVIINRCVELPLREAASSADVSPDDQPTLPPLWESLLPIIVPVALIAMETQSDTVLGWFSHASPGFQAWLQSTLGTVGSKNGALLIGAVLAIVTYKRHRSPETSVFQETINGAVLTGGTIILVTSAGSAFGQMMQQTSVAELLAQLPGSSPVTIVLAAFLVTTLVRTAQGSATVAMITSAGVFAPLVTTGFVDVHPLYVALAIGCGSKPFSWMNDSGFLVITRTSGMTDSEGLRYVTTTMAIAAVVGLAVIITGVIWFPELPTRLPS